MDAESIKADPPKRKRRWFQFSLRTLLIGVMLLAVAFDFCGYVGRQAEIVRERRALLDRIVRLGGCYNNISRRYFPMDWHAVHLRGGTPSPPLGQPTLSAIRELLGDEAIQCVGLSPDASLYDEARAKFPETSIGLMGPPPLRQ
jgi:hypothetical protein